MKHLNWRHAANADCVLDYLAHNRRLPAWRAAPSPIDECTAHRKTPRRIDGVEVAPGEWCRLEVAREAKLAACRLIDCRHQHSTGAWYCTNTTQGCVHKRPDALAGPPVQYATGHQPPKPYASDSRTLAVIAAWERGIASALADDSLAGAAARALRDYDNPSKWSDLDALAATEYPRLDTNARRIAAQECLARFIAAHADAEKRAERTTR